MMRDSSSTRIIGASGVRVSHDEVVEELRRMSRVSCFICRPGRSQMAASAILDAMERVKEERVIVQEAVKAGLDKNLIVCQRLQEQVSLLGRATRMASTGGGGRSASRLLQLVDASVVGGSDLSPSIEELSAVISKLVQAEGRMSAIDASLSTLDLGKSASGMELHKRFARSEVEAHLLDLVRLLSLVRSILDWTVRVNQWRVSAVAAETVGAVADLAADCDVESDLEKITTATNRALRRDPRLKGHKYVW